MVIDILAGGENGLWIKYEVIVSKGIEEFTNERGENGIRIFLTEVGGIVNFRQSFIGGRPRKVRFLGTCYNLGKMKDYLRFKSALGIEIATAVLA